MGGVPVTLRVGEDTKFHAARRTIVIREINTFLFCTHAFLWALGRVVFLGGGFSG